MIYIKSELMEKLLKITKPKRESMEGSERISFFQNEKQKDFYLLRKKKCWCNGEIKKETSREVVVRIKSNKR